MLKRKNIKNRLGNHKRALNALTKMVKNDAAELLNGENAAVDDIHLQ